MPDVQCDVLVAGGGTAGTAAAIAAARLGADTVVVESLGSLGGTQSNGWVTPMMPNYLGDFKLNRGINLDIIRSQNEAQPAAGTVEHGDVWYDPVYLAKVLDDLAIEAGVKCLFNATLVSAQANSGRLETVEVACRGGHLRIGAKCWVDATGDAELSRLAGAQLMGGDESGTHQPMTLRFTMAGFDLQRLAHEVPIWRTISEGHMEAGFGEARESPVLGPLISEAIRSGVLEEDDLGYFQCFTMNGRPGELAFNCPRIFGLDPLNPFELSEAYQVGRAKIYRIASFLKRYLPGCESAYVSGIAPLMGIRESRRVVGEYVLTEQDHHTCRKFPDAIARNRYPVDIHKRQGVDYRKFPPGEFHDVPYGSIVVSGFSNLWVAGRCLSADFVAQSAVRIQPVCRSVGQAAGSAAALCAQNDCAARDLPYRELLPFLDLELPTDLGSAPSIR